MKRQKISKDDAVRKVSVGFVTTKPSHVGYLIYRACEFSELVCGSLEHNLRMPPTTEFRSNSVQ